MRLIESWSSSVTDKLAIVLVVAVSAMTVTVHAVTMDDPWPGSPAVSGQIVRDEVLSLATEREMAVAKLRHYGFSEQETRMLLPTMSNAKIRHLAQAETLDRSGDPRSLVIVLLSFILLIFIIDKLTDAFGKSPPFADSQASSAAMPSLQSGKQRTDAGRSDSVPTRRRPRRTYRNGRRIQPGARGDPAADLKQPPRRGQA